MSLSFLRCAGALALLTFASCFVGYGCGSDSTSPSPTPPVDVDTPVQDLPGFMDLLNAVGLTPEADHGLASWVDVFRNGLDIANGIDDPQERETALEGWWDESLKALDGIVGTENVDTVVAWLVEQYGPRPAGGTP